MRKKSNDKLKKSMWTCGMTLCMLMTAVMVSGEITVQASQDSTTNQVVKKITDILDELEKNNTNEDKTEQQIEEFYDDAVFVGDSIMLGFRNYAMKRQDDKLLSSLDFLAAGSFSINNSFWDVDNKNSVHPLYKGEKRYVWESISIMESKRVFIMLGMNDLNITGVEGTCEKYEELIGNIKESSPDSEIYLMSMTYILHGKEKGKLQNDTIREFNGMLEGLAEENGWGYVNIADAIADKNGDLAAEYCSDDFAHLNSAAYDVWVTVLKDYATEQLAQETQEEETKK